MHCIYFGDHSIIIFTPIFLVNHYLLSYKQKMNFLILLCRGRVFFCRNHLCHVRGGECTANAYLYNSG